MSILVVGFDIDLSEIQENLESISSDVYFEPIPIGEPIYESPGYQEVPLNLDAVIYVYSKAARYSSQLLLYYGKVASRFTFAQDYYYCFESFTEKDKERLEKGAIDLSFEQLQSLVKK